MSVSARGQFVATSSALGFHSGGMWDAGPLIGALSTALDALPEIALEDPLRVLVGPGREIIAARLMSDESAYATAKRRLTAGLYTLWADRALRGGGA